MNQLFKRFSNISSKSSVEKEIDTITRVTNKHFTPEIKLNLITPSCALWKQTPEKCPFPDPYWAFYWPGGQAMTRFILDNPSFVQKKNVLDIGCGCGATAIASCIKQAHCVVANDTDTTALEAVGLNYKLNFSAEHRKQILKFSFSNISFMNDYKFFVSSDNFLKDQNDSLSQLTNFFDIVFFGDMFYDENVVNYIYCWMVKICSFSNPPTILLSDPGRGFLNGHAINKHLRILETYNLPSNVKEEHYGCSNVDIMQWDPGS